MALIVEDGSIVAGAESYTSVAYADTYWSNRPTDPNAAVWAALQIAAKESSLRQATDHMMQEFRGNWAGYRVNQNQALDWPRYGVTRDDWFVVDYKSVPAEVQRACCEYAVRASAGPLKPDLERYESKVKIGPLEIDYDPSSPVQTTYKTINNMIGLYLKRGSGSGSMGRLVRA